MSFVIRTVQWKFLLADDGIILGPLKDLGLLPEDFHVSRDAVRGGGRDHVQLPAVHGAAAVRRAGADRQVVWSRPPRICTRADGKAFRKVVWPLSLPGVFAAFLLTFVPATGDYVNA